MNNNNAILTSKQIILFMHVFMAVDETVDQAF